MTCYQKNFTSYQREAIERLKNLLGSTPFTYEKNTNNHMQVKIDGIERVFHTGATPSDFRSLSNFLGDVRAEINRINTPDIIPTELPGSQVKANAKQEVCTFVEQQTREQLKKLKRNLRTIRKQEYKMLTELQDDVPEQLACSQLAESIRAFRKRQTAVELEKAIQKNKGGLFITPGLIKSARNELDAFLDDNLATLAEYRERLKHRSQRRQKESKSIPETIDLELEPELSLQSTTDTAQNLSSLSNDTPELVKAETQPDKTQEHLMAKKGKSRTKNKCSKQQRSQPLVSENPSSADAALPAEIMADSQKEWFALMGEESDQRVVSLKQLGKDQIRVLMNECQVALSQKHQEDIKYLVAQMQSRGVDLVELEEALR